MRPTAVQNDQPTLLTEGSIFKKLFLFSIPILLGNVLQSLNGSINSIFIGKLLGEQALAAASNGFMIMFFLISAIFGLAMAFVILMGQHLGAQRVDQAKKVVGTSVTFFLILSLIISLSGIFFTHLIMNWIGTPTDILEMANTYMRIIFAGVPFLFGFSLVMAILRGSGNSKTPVYYLLVSVGMDIVMNPLLIKGIGPFPEMGIAGSATATFLAQMISFILLLIHLYVKKNFLRITKDDLHLLRMDVSIIRFALLKGLPMGLNMVIVSASNVLLIKLVNTFGSEAVAAFAAANQISNYVQLPALAIGGAVTFMAAQCIGAGMWERITRIAWAGIVFNIVMTGLLVLLLYGFNREALALFLPSEGKAIELGMQINAITLWSFMIYGIFSVIVGVVRSAGATLVPMIISFISMIIIRNPLAVYFGENYGFDSIWFCFPIGFAGASVFIFIYYWKGNWKELNLKPD
ncbi:MATE family efflux transporter [Paenibacillus sp. FSL R7-0652]|uniref:MATE family efflux transporter n=1 Tax=Paenibacillus sp. FSL R7-0652 TaxID=2921687 RepID=UPI00315B0EC3